MGARRKEAPAVGSEDSEKDSERELDRDRPPVRKLSSCMLESRPMSKEKRERCMEMALIRVKILTELHGVLRIMRVSCVSSVAAKTLEKNLVCFNRTWPRHDVTRVLFSAKTLYP